MNRRTLYLTEEADEVLRGLSKRHPQGASALIEECLWASQEFRKTAKRLGLSRVTRTKRGRPPNNGDK